MRCTLVLPATDRSPEIHHHGLCIAHTEVLAKQTERNTQDENKRQKRKGEEEREGEKKVGGKKGN